MQMNNSMDWMVCETGHRASEPCPGTFTYPVTQRHPDPKYLGYMKVLVQRHDWLNYGPLMINLAFKFSSFPGRETRVYVFWGGEA